MGNVAKYQHGWNMTFTVVELLMIIPKSTYLSISLPYFSIYHFFSLTLFRINPTMRSIADITFRGLMPSLAAGGASCPMDGRRCRCGGVAAGRARRKETIRMKRRAADVRRRRLEKVAVAERSAMKRVLNDVHRQQWEKQRSADPVHHLRRGVRRSGRGASGVLPSFDKPLHILIGLQN